MTKNAIKKYAVIVAGGSGSRMNSAVPKQFLLLNEKPVLYYSVKAFMDAYENVEIILVLQQNFLEEGKAIIGKYFPGKEIVITAGGETRFHSVQNGLKYVKESSIVFVHDAVRCLVTPSLIKRCFSVAAEKGSAIPACNANDSLRIITDDGSRVLNRSGVKIIQTPQTFKSELLLTAFATDYKVAFTDEATVAEASGYTVELTEGEASNIKITTPIDLITAAAILQGR